MLRIFDSTSRPSVLAKNNISPITFLANFACKVFFLLIALKSKPKLLPYALNSSSPPLGAQRRVSEASNNTLVTSSPSIFLHLFLLFAGEGEEDAAVKCSSWRVMLSAGAVMGVFVQECWEEAEVSDGSGIDAHGPVTPVDHGADSGSNVAACASPSTSWKHVAGCWK